jgi:Bacterial Ig-like domain
MKYLSILFVLIIYSCANIVMPTGGAKDSSPPKLESTYPPNNSTLFKGDEISFKFDEFVELETPQKNIFVSPYTKQLLDFYIVGKKVYIHFPDGLKPNTTYSIQANGAFKDYTEGNKLTEASLNFSTGAVLDSGKLSFIVLGLKDKKPSDNAIVALVKNKNDFYGSNYAYLAKTNLGIANFNNLNNDQYWAYTFVDSNQNYKWDKNEHVAFNSTKLTQGSKPKAQILFPNLDSVRLNILPDSKSRSIWIKY